MFEARLLLLPMDLPVSRLLRVAQAAGSENWAVHVTRVRGILGSMPDIVTHFQERITDRIRDSAILPRKRFFLISLVFLCLMQFIFFSFLIV